MRVVEDAKEVSVMHSHVLWGAFKWFVGTTALTVGASVVAFKFSARYRQLSKPLRVGMVVLPVCAGTTIGAEEELLSYERQGHSLYDRFWKTEGEREQAKKERDWKVLLADYRYHLVAAAWCAGVGGTLAWSYGNPYLSSAQKVIHARMYSQGITVAAAMAAAAVSPFASNNQEVIKEETEQLFLRRLAYEEERYREGHPTTS